MKKNKIDSNTVEAFQAGDEEAFKKIYRHYSRKIYFLAYQYCMQEALSNDVVQNTFIIVYKNISKLKHKEAFHTWIFKIGYHETLKIMNKENRVHYDNGIDIERLQDLKSRQSFREIENDLLVNSVFKCIQSMKPKLKATAYLIYREELTLKEIATIQRIPVGTVKSRSNRINKILREELIQKGITPQTFKSRVIISPTILMSVFSYGLSNPNLQINVLDTVLEIGKAQTISKVGFLSSLTTQTKVGITLSSTLLVSSGILLYQGEHQNKPIAVEQQYTEVMHKNEVDPCAFVLVQFDSNYQSMVEVEIETTNEDYDYILINGIDTRTIKENGSYDVTLMKDNQVLDHRELLITNIDNEGPIIASIQETGQWYYITFEDSKSGVNYDSLTYYVNGQQSNNYHFDETTKTISFEYHEPTSNVFYVQDQVGNWRDITIVSE